MVNPIPAEAAPALSPEDKKQVAFFQGMTVLIASTVMTLCWTDFRLPNGDVMLVVAAVLPAAMIHSESDWRVRLKLALMIATLAGMLQFSIAMLKEQKILILLIPAIESYLILRFCRHTSAAIVCLAIGWQALPASGGLLPGVDRWVSLYIAAAATFFATVVVRAFEPAGLRIPFFLKPRMPPQRMLRIVAVLVIGNWLYLAFQIPQGNWIALTSCLIYSGSSPALELERLAMLRIWGTPLGLYCGFLYLSLLTFFNYQFVYLIPVLGSLSFYLYYRTRNYILFSAVFMMAMALYVDLGTLRGSALNYWDLFFCRIVNTAIGAILVIVFHHFFLPDDMRKPPTAAEEAAWQNS